MSYSSYNFYDNIHDNSETQKISTMLETNEDSFSSDSEEFSEESSFNNNNYNTKLLRSSNNLQSELYKWNEEFQRVLEHPSKTPEEYSERIQSLDDFIKSFVEYVSPIAKNIIKQDSKKNKNIQNTSDIGGIIGGEKFKQNGVFFKFARDNNKIFNNDYIPKKIAGLDLQALRHLIATDIPFLHFPLTIIVDYLGRRIIACPILPITDNTIIYGSSNGGKTLHNSSKEFSLIMEKLGNKLNIKGHIIQNPTNSIYIHGPFDMEGHLGLDCRYYLLDFSRVFPSEPPKRKYPKGNLYHLFRGEFIKKYIIPLSSDAFFKFSSSKLDNNDVFEAYKYFLDLIPKITKEFINEISIDDIYNKSNIICDYLHANGINLRYLGLILKNIPDNKKHYKNIVSCEIIFRCFNRYINEKISQYSSDEIDSIYNEIVNIFKILFGINTHDNISFISFIQLNLLEIFSQFNIDNITDIVLNRLELPLLWLFNRLTKRLQISWIQSNTDILNMFLDSSIINNISGSYIQSIDIRVKSVSAKEIFSMDRIDKKTQEEFFESQIIVKEKSLGSCHPAIADSIENYASSISHIDSKKAIMLYKKAITIRKLILYLSENQTGLQCIYFQQYIPKYNLSTLKFYLANNYYELSRLQRECSLYSNALKHIKKSIKLYKNININSLYKFRIAECYYEKGWCYKNCSNFDKAKNSYMKSINILHSNLNYGTDIHTKSNCSIQILLGLLYVEKARVCLHLYEFSDALSLQIQALYVLENALGKFHSRIGTICNNLAISYCISKNFTDAIDNVNRGLIIRRKKLGNKHSYVANSICTLSQIQFLNEIYTLSLSSSKSDIKYEPYILLLNEAEDIYSNISKFKKSIVFFIKARIYHYCKIWDLAEKYYNKALDILKISQGDLLYAAVLTSITSFYYDKQKPLNDYIHYINLAQSLLYKHLHDSHKDIIKGKELLNTITKYENQNNMLGFKITQCICVSTLVLYINVIE